MGYDSEQKAYCLDYGSKNKTPGSPYVTDTPWLARSVVVGYFIDICSKSRIVSLKQGKSERSPRFAAFFSTRGGPIRLLLPPPCPPALTAPWEGLHGGLLEGSCGRRCRRVMRNRLDVGTYAPAPKYEARIQRRCAQNPRLYVL